MVPQDNQFSPSTDEDKANLQQLAEQMVDKLKQLHYRYPEVSDSLNSLQKQVSQKMQDLQELLLRLPQRDRDIFTLLVIHQIHNTVDEIFQMPES